MSGIVLQLLSAWLFALGVAAVVTRRSPIAVLLGIELMLNAANILLVLGLWRGGPEGMAVRGLAAVFLVIALAAAEAAVGLGVMMAASRGGRNADLDRADSLRG